MDVARELIFNLLAPVPPPSYHNTFTIVMNPQTPDTPANPISTNAKKTTAADADPTLKLQRGNEGGTNNNAGSVSGKPRYRFSTGQKDKLQRLLPEYKSYGSKRKQAFDAMYSKHLMSDASFATPAGITAEEWKRTLLKWFDNNGKKSGQTVKTDVDAQSKDVSTADESTLVQNHVPHPATPSTNQSTTMSWAKLRDLAKFFNELTSGDMDIKSGRMVFAGSRGMREEEISQEWNELSVDERNKWEKRAAAECDVQHNRECFVSSLLKLLQGCLQFGHIGHGEIATVVVFDEGFDTEGRKIGSHGIFASSDMKCSAIFEEVVKDPYALYRDLSAHLIESRKDTMLNDLKLRTQIPVDSEGLARFPTISDLDDASRSQLRQVYEDFMTAIWFQAGYTGSSAGITGGWFQDLFEYLMANYCSSGRVFMLKKPSPGASDVGNSPPPDLVTETAVPVAHLGTPEVEVVSSKAADDDLHAPLAATEQKTPEAPALPIPSPNTPNAAHPLTPLTDTDTAMASPSATSPLHSDSVDSNAAVDLSLDENNKALENMHNDEGEDWMDEAEDTEPLDAETKFTAPDADANVCMNHTDAGASSGPDPEGNVGTDITKTNGKKGAGA
ncbi:hypothetical protein BT96DRAFT_999766 [Gymnopus androsaceus JB14]|uniref:Uncharacterized protein n=1 Tax=Gymnopus androsaceus JB14 TaxID=1447944 RepID=A0A6A4H5Z6_9AGAR|nr:hypothetical protein BT96DRAFT_999766 [Gymnopus androsaceus JB14]